MPFHAAFLPFPPPKAALPPLHIPKCTAPPPSRPPSTPSTPHRKRHTHPHPRTHTNAINAHAKSGNLLQMRRAVRAATADGYALNVVNYTTMANAHAQHGDPHNAFSIFAAMRDARIRPTNVTLRVALKAAERIPDARYATDAILECLRWVARERVQPCEKSWNMAIRSLAQRKAFPQLRNVFTWMHNRSLDSNVGNVPSPNQYSYNTYIHALGKDARFKEAFKLFLDMLMSTVHPDVVTYNTLLEITLGDDKGALGDASNIVHAILKSMNRRNVKPNTTTETLILRLLCSNGKTVDPSLIWSRVMPVFADEESRKQVDKMFFDSVINAFAYAADVDGMHFALTQMTRHNIKLDQLTVRAVLLGASFLGDVSLARTILDLSYQHGMRCDAHAYTSAISSCARSNPPDPNAARELILQAASRGTTWTSAMINAAISSHGDNFSGAINMWKQLRLQTPANSRNVFAERVVYDALMRVCGRAARPDVALRVFYAAKKSEHLIPNSSSSRFVFNAFRRGVREANLQHAIDGNPLKKQYERHLRTECGATDDTEFAIERIRIKL